MINTEAAGSASAHIAPGAAITIARLYIVCNTRFPNRWKSWRIAKHSLHIELAAPEMLMATWQNYVSSNVFAWGECAMKFVLILRMVVMGQGGRTSITLRQKQRTTSKATEIQAMLCRPCFLVGVRAAKRGRSRPCFASPRFFFQSFTRALSHSLAG